MSRTRGRADARFGQYYYANCFSVEGPVAYGRSQYWLEFFGRLADHIVQDFEPRTALDAGCAMGMLVEALRDRGVEAEGVDISEYAIAQAADHVRPHLRVGSVTEPFPRSYDLIVCIETLEHLPRADAERAAENICRHTDDVLFSSTPGHFKEATHVNVQPPEHWAELFARQGFFRDFGTDPSTYLSRWAVRFRRSDEPAHRLVAQYEGRLWHLADEAGELRDLAIENRGELQRLAPKEAELEEIKASRAWRVTVAARTLFRRIRPLPPRESR